MSAHFSSPLAFSAPAHSPNRTRLQLLRLPHGQQADILKPVLERTPAGQT